MEAAVAGAAVVSVGQIGGQTAQTIVNVGKQPRVLAATVRVRMQQLLSPYAGTTIGFASFAGDPEASTFKRQLMAVFNDAGWVVIDQSTFMFFGDKAGIVLTIPFGTDEELAHIQAAAAALSETGQLLAGNRGDMAKDAGLYVQVWPTP